MSKEHTNTVKIIIIAAAYFLFLSFPGYVEQSIILSCERCVYSLLPSVFPIMVISGQLTGILSFENTRFSGFFSRLTGIPESCLDIFLIGLICGYPIPAYTAAEKYKSGVLSADEASVCAALFSNPSPSFLILFVGGKILGSTFYGVLLYISTAVSELICSHFLFKKHPNKKNQPDIAVFKPETAFADSLNVSAHTMLGIFGCVLFFSIFADISLNLSRLIDVPFFMQAVIAGAFEITRGLSCLQNTTGAVRFVLAPALCSFGGLSVYFQNRCAADKAGISMKSYFPVKLFQGVVLTVLFLTAKQAFPK